MANDHPPVDGPQAHRSMDPLPSAATNSPTLTTALLLRGEKLTLVQRIGVILISTFIFAFGVVLAINSIDEIRAGTRPMPPLLITASLALFVGAGGLINAFRFKRK